ncbi:DUF7660 family protein [Aureibacter tunicatorum]|uniref:DUF7660 domain-containing protein n=1 Tax=Aureibacter tunicatorum TaxID=866807 RepID=A0AAE3XM93_9BACT|nr:hypothetical protein [Aureibacter tunicatorum]MDR6238544.1 hypothetical protein [Aureibacter tunicatorum]BDD05525.1 hypothetical protein AUTU_30080 [Aureibacter tunicatorum]
MDYLSIEVNDRKSFSEFLSLLHAEYITNGKNWENNNLELFLEALQSYTEDIDGYYKNTEPNINPEKASWKLFSDLLKGATVYE